jgi:hypothetical protein
MNERKPPVQWKGHRQIAFCEACCWQGMVTWDAESGDVMSVYSSLGHLHIEESPQCANVNGSQFIRATNPDAYHQAWLMGKVLP